MPVFEYTARNLKGDLVKDKIDLASRDDVIAHLRKNRMVVVQVRESKGKGGGLGDFFKPGIKTRDVVIFTRQFATMINSGLPLVQALDILAAADRKQSPRGRHAAGGVRRRKRSYARRRAAQAPQGVQRSVREHGGRR